MQGGGDPVAEEVGLVASQGVCHQRLAAVINFGGCGVGDPACDLAIAWTLLSRSGRDTFRTVLGIDADTWSCGRGWALWKALISLADHLDDDSDAAAIPRRVLGSILAEHSQEH